ncbi:MAG: BatD family protein [Rudaea sp.]
MNKFAGFFAFAAMWFCMDAHAVEVRAWLDRSTMQMGETVTLNVQVSGDTGAAKPDFSALDSDFEMLGTQSSTSVNMVNGQTTSKLLWAIALQPKHAGTLTIPALSVAGQATQPISLTVQPASAGSGGKAGDDVYIETTVEPHSPYVQQQVRLTVKLYYAVNLVDGSLDDPQASGVVVRKLGQDSNYRAQVGGREYRVVERHYALLPETSGTVTLPPIGFRGHAMDPNDVNSFFSRGRSVAAHSDPIALDVRKRPAASGTDIWLPARSVTLTVDGVDASTKARVGDPITMTLHLKAKGLGFEQLPELKLPAIDGADIYPDKPITQNRDDGQWLYAQRDRKFAIVPNRAGTLTLPAISVDWWDTAHDEAQTAQVPSVTIHVAAAAGSGSTSTAPPVEAAAPTAHASPASAPRAIQVTEGGGVQLRLWRSLAFLALLLWAATVVAWILWLLAQRRRQRATQPPMEAAIDTRGARAAFRDACAREDCSAIAHALIAWARLSQPRLRNLGGLARALDDKAQVDAVNALERACYGGGASTGLAETLDHVFKSEPHFRHRISDAAPNSPLPALYPFRV